MNIVNRLSNIKMPEQQNAVGNVSKPDSETRSFKDTIKEMLNDVNDLQRVSGNTTQQFLNGEISDVHQVMVAKEKAKIGLQLTLEIRNKILEGYREIMRMS